MNEELKAMIISVCQGNPGAANTLGELFQLKGDRLITPLCIAMLMTKSKSYALWMVRKDLSDHDIEKTADFLKTWYDSSTIPLEKYIEPFLSSKRSMTNHTKGAKA